MLSLTERNDGMATAHGFSTLPADALREFTSIGSTCCREPHTVLFREGSSADHFLILCAGRVKVTSSASSGRLLLLRVAVAGDLLGLPALEEHAIHHVTAETLSLSTIKSIRRADFLRLMHAHSDVGRITTLAIAREYQSALLSARRLAHHTSAAGKLASTLLDWANPDNIQADPTSAPVSFSMHLNQEDLGSMAGLSRETVSRLLTRFRREGLIEQTDDHMTLNNPVRLQARYR